MKGTTVPVPTNIIFIGDTQHDNHDMGRYGKRKSFHEASRDRFHLSGLLNHLESVESRSLSFILAPCRSPSCAAAQAPYSALAQMGPEEFQSRSMALRIITMGTQILQQLVSDQRIMTMGCENTASISSICSIYSPCSSSR